MAKRLYGDLPVDERRLLFVKKRLLAAGRDMMGANNVIMRLTPVAVQAMTEFDRNEYVEGYVKWVTSEEAEATQIAIMMGLFNFGCERIQEWCDNHHERPKTCDCTKIQQVLMGLAKPVEDIPAVEGGSDK